MTKRRDDRLAHYAAQWQLAMPVLIAETPTSWVYRVRQADHTLAALKVLTEIGAVDEAHAPTVLRYYAGQGAVRLLAADDGAHLLEYVSGDDLVGMAAADDEAATRVIGQVLNRLHQPRDQAEMVAGVPLRRWFRALFERAEVGDMDSIFRRAARLADALLDEQLSVRVLHGDIHHANILHDATRGWLAIDPKGLVGERTYDMANTFYNPANHDCADPTRIRMVVRVLSEVTGVAEQRMLQFAFVYGCLSAAWTLQDVDGESQAVALAATTQRVARQIEALLE